MIPFRDENPTRRFPIVVILLIAANLAVFAYTSFLKLRDPLDYFAFIGSYGLVPRVLLGTATVQDSVRHIVTLSLPPGARLLELRVAVHPLQPIWLSVFTSMFLHAGLWHFLGNMLYLWIFGNNVEDVLGHLRFIIFYFLCGALAAAAQLVMSLHSLLPVVGASGAIAGVLGAYYVKFPRARVQCLVFLFFFITVLMVPARIVLLIWFLLQIWQSLEPAAVGGSGGIAVFAHIGGFAAGWALIRSFESRRRPRLLRR